MTSPMLEMLFLFRTLDDFFAYFAFCCVPEAGDCMGGCLITWYHVFAVWTLNIVFAVFILCRIEACPIIGTSPLAHRHKLLLSPKHFWGALSINVQDLHFIKRWITDFTSIFGLLLLLALLWIQKKSVRPSNRSSKYLQMFSSTYAVYGRSCPNVWLLSRSLILSSSMLVDYLKFSTIKSFSSS